MSVRTRATFVCDRCGHEQDATRTDEGIESMPSGWCRIKTTMDASSERDVCHPCERSFREWLKDR